MSAVLLYQFKVALTSLVLYIFFRLFLAKETFHAFNRVVVLLSMSLSAVLPLCVVTRHVSGTAPVSTTDLGGFVITHEPAGFDWTAVPLAVYITGAAAVLLSAAVSVVSLLCMVSRGRKIRQPDGIVLVLVDAPVAPMSWMNYMILSTDDYGAPGRESIIIHEKAHIRLHHSFDILFCDLFTAIQWFNPAAWMMRYDLRAIHEYEADEQVLKSGIDAKQYQLLLVKKAFGANGRSVSNNFNHGQLKKRIAMMLMKKSPAFKALKFLYVLPLVCMGLAVNARTVYDGPGESSGKLALNNGNISVSVAGNSAGVATSLTDSVKIYVNGEPVSEEVMSALDPEKISSMSVTKTGDEGAIHIYIDDSAEETGNNFQVMILSADDAELNDEPAGELGDVLVISDNDGGLVEISRADGTEVEMAGKDGISVVGKGQTDFYADGKKIDYETLKGLSAEDIQSITVRKPDESGGRGRIDIVTTKK